MDDRDGEDRDALPGLLLFPMVDIVFSTTAVLIVVMLVHLMLRQQPEVKPIARPYLLTCDRDAELVLHRANRTSEPVPQNALRRSLQMISDEELRPIAIFAFGAECTSKYWELQAVLEDLGRAAATGRIPPPPSFTYFPLAGTSKAASDFVASWRLTAETRR